MNALVYLIEQIANGLYILIGLGVLWYWRKWRLARQEFRATPFELERDLARYKQANAITALIVLIELALVLVGVQRVVAPAIRAQANTSQVVAGVVTDGIFNTPTPSVSNAGQIDASGIQISEQDPALEVLATPTLTPTPVGTIVPNAPPPIGCDTPNATLQVPANGMRVFQPTLVVGTAYTENFAFYRFEIKGPSTLNSFVVYDEHLSPVTETSELGQFNPAFYETGLYEFRLMVFDITTTLRASCLVNIYISEPVPTPTPIGQTRTLKESGV